MKLTYFAIFLLAMPIASAAIEGFHKCGHPACLEGTDINFTVLIFNNLEDNIVIDDIYIKDLETEQLLAVDARKERIVLSGTQEEFVLPSTVQAPLQGFTFYYVPCFKAQSFNEEGVTSKGEVCGTTATDLTVVPFSKVECRADDECEAEEYCNTYSLFKCRPLECADNQTIQDHGCVDLSCNFLQYSESHRCVYNIAFMGGIMIVILVVVLFIVAMSSWLKVKHK